jgi:Zn-dependent protease with chaperone function
LHTCLGMRAFVLSLGLAAGLSAIACSVLSDEDAATQEAAHTEGDPTFAQHEWLWADESEAEFKKNAVDNASGWMGPADFLALDHPITLRLQFWIDRMDDVLRTAYPDKLKATPKPKLIIRKSDTANAWVTAMPVTWNVKTRVKGATIADAGDASVEADGASSLMLRRNGVVETTTASTTFERAFTADQGATFAKFFNDNFARCRMASEAEGFVFDEICGAKNLRVREGEKLAYYATAKYVTFTTGYIRQLMDEDRIISTLAHELGHYYRSHTNVPTDVVNYFYRLDTLHAHKPAPDPRYIEQTAKARQKLRDGSWDWNEENALMRDHVVGFYTTEQEADEIALEVMTKIGVPAGVAVDKVLNMLKNSPGDNGIGWAECSMLRDLGWKDAAGKDVSVPVGEPSNAHHNLCFRVFNMTREINAHRYEPARRPSPPGEEWSLLFARLITELAAPPPPPPPPPDGGSPGDAGTD